MTQAQEIYAALIAANLVVNIPLLLHFLTPKRNTDLMAVSAAAQAVVDELNTASTTLTTALADASTNASAQNAEDLAAIKTAADALVAAITAAATPPAA